MDRFKKKKDTPAAAGVVARPADKPAEPTNKPGKTAGKKATSEASLAAAYRVLRQPLVTEKAARLQGRHQYTFLVAPAATKSEVKEAVRALYNVAPTAVNFINVEGRRVRFGRASGKRGNYKKAIVTVPKGESIVIHQGV